MVAQDVQPEDTGAVAARAPVSKVRRALSSLKRELSDDDLASPGTQKMLLEELERLTEENSSLSSFRSLFHESDKKVAILGEKQKKNISFEVISGACLAIGSASLGYAPSVWDHPPSGPILIAFGVVLTIGGVVAKAIRL